MTKYPSKENLINPNTNWMYSLLGSESSSSRLYFRPDGLINGHHANEHAWQVGDDGILSLLSREGQVSVRFDQVTYDDGNWTMMGDFLIVPEANITMCLSTKTSRLGFDKHWTSYQYRDLIKQHNWEIGDFSYGTPLVFDQTMAKLIIGRFCSIAQGATIALGNHRTDTLTSFPFSTFGYLWPNAPHINDHVTKGDVIIGSDVWLGANCFIASGVNIGHGAVVGAYTVVTRDIPPYAIVVGNPAKIVRYRFSETQIEALLSIAWWNWSPEKINANLHLIMSADIDAFISAVKHGKLAL